VVFAGYWTQELISSIMAGLIEFLANKSKANDCVLENIARREELERTMSNSKS